MDLLRRLFSTNEFMPHGMCYEWNPAVIQLHVWSDALIALAYYSIPLTLLYFVRRRKDLAFDWMFLCFAVFIVACGTTHVMEIVNIWHPAYWLSGVIKAVTAATSIVTAILLIRLVPKALALPSPEQLRKTNAILQNEIHDRIQAVEKIESLNRELRSQSEEVAAANKELETFSYSVSHDLRAPLRHINGYIELLEEKSASLGDEEQRYMGKISHAAQRMGTLIDDLLAFSRMARAPLQMAWVETGDVVAQAREELSPDLKNREIDWKIENLPRVHVDKNLFMQVWVNLLGNAIKYTKNRPRAEIEIGCRETPSEFEFHIKDNGAGFDMAYADKLFGIFQRLHFREEFEGNGVGLANVQRIIQRHGGRIWAQGEVNVGATFHFTLPRAASN